MRSRKFKTIIACCIGFIVVLGIFGSLTTDYAVNRVMDSFAAGLEADSGPDYQTPPIERGKQSPIPSETAQAQHVSGDNSSRKPITGTVSEEQAKKVQKNLTVSDKATVVSVIFKSLDVSDLNKLRNMASGGLTVEEKREAKELLLARLSPDDYNKLSALAKKYGISRGLTYDVANQEHG